MSFARISTAAIALFALIGACAAQKLAPAGDGGASGSTVARPRIFQSGAQSVPVSISPDRIAAQLSGGSSRLASVDEVEAMEVTLEKFEAAFENLSLPQLRQVWPGMDRQHETALKQVFAGFRETSWSRQLRLDCAVPRVAQASAVVQCRETLTYGTGKGKTKEVGPARVAVSLKEEAGNWLVADMKGAN
jgi:hypothetical protein